MASEWTVGRNPDCDIVLQDPSVSRRHAAIRSRGEGQYEISDLGSSGGTHVQKDGRWRRVDRELVGAATPIRLGDHATSVGELMGRSSASKAVFLSYASGDVEAARAVADYLEPRGFSCWIAPRDVRPGHDYGEEIIRGIEGARAFVLIHSGAANRSTFVKREVERAVSKGKPIFPIRIENVAPSPALELFISTPQWIEAWSGKLGDHMERLLEILARNEGAQAPTAQIAPVGRARAKIGSQARARTRRRAMPILAGVAALVAAVVAAVVWLWPPPVSEPVTKAAGATASPKTIARVEPVVTSKPATSTGAQVVGGVTVGLKNIVLSADRKTIIANLSLTNTNQEPVLLMVVDATGSSFMIPTNVDDSVVRTKGIASCGGSTGLCLRQPEERWSRLDSGRTHAASVYASWRTGLGNVETVGVNVRVLVRKGDDGQPYDVSFVGVGVD
jgi:hypothetical protein